MFFLLEVQQKRVKLHFVMEVQTEDIEPLGSFYMINVKSNDSIVPVNLYIQL